MTAARTAVVRRCAQFMTKNAAAVIATPVNATVPAKRAAPAARRNGASSGTRRTDHVLAPVIDVKLAQRGVVEAVRERGVDVGRSHEPILPEFD